MADKNNFLLILAVIILLMLVVLVLRCISGLVNSNVEARVDINREVIVCDRYDNSHAIAVTVDSGSDALEQELSFKSLRTGEILERETLCEAPSCEGRINKNFIIPCRVPSGEYFFEIHRLCTYEECKQLDPTIRSGIIEVSHT